MVGFNFTLIGLACLFTFLSCVPGAHPLRASSAAVILWLLSLAVWLYRQWRA